MAEKERKAQIEALSKQLEELQGRLDADRRAAEQMAKALEELRAALEPPPPAAPSAPPPSPSAPPPSPSSPPAAPPPSPPAAPPPAQHAREPKAPAPKPSLLRRIVNGCALIALAVGAPSCCLYFTCEPFQSQVDVFRWDGRSTFVCPVNGDITIKDRRIHLDQGAAISMISNCTLTLIRCDIKAPVGIEVHGGGASISLEQSRIEGTIAAIQTSVPISIEARGSRVIGAVHGWNPTRYHGVVAIPASEVQGAPHAVDPSALIDVARWVAGLDASAKLGWMRGDYVGSSGLVDLDAAAYKGRVSYRFEVGLDAPPPPPRPSGIPLGVPLPGPLPPPPILRRYREVVLDREGMRATQASEDSRGAWRGPPPRCSFKQVWDAARSGDAPADAVATIEYYAGADGPFQFRIDGTSYSFSVLDETCKRAPSPAY